MRKGTSQVKTINLTTGITIRKSLSRGFLALAAWIVAMVLTAGNARADIMCSWFGQCFYRSPGFKIRVVDKETGKPLADVHALAEWVQYGSFGQYPLLVAQDATSGPDGWLVFPPWGPTRGSAQGLRPSDDPRITLYKIGYDAMTLINRVEQSVQYDRVRGFAQDGQTFAVGKFQGTTDDRIEQLRSILRGGGMRDLELTLKFRDAYLGRLRRVWAELDAFPERYKTGRGLYWVVDEDRKLLEQKGR